MRIARTEVRLHYICHLTTLSDRRLSLGRGVLTPLLFLSPACVKRNMSLRMRILVHMRHATNWIPLKTKPPAPEEDANG